MIEPLNCEITDAELETAIAVLETKDWFAIKVSSTDMRRPR
jgi:hypothetical protein